MALAGGAVPCFWMWLEDGNLIIAYFGFANGAIVIDDVAEAYQRLVAGEKIFMHRYGHNLTQLRGMLNDLARQRNIEVVSEKCNAAQ